MSTIDTTKIKVGDEIVARIKVSHVLVTGKFQSDSSSVGSRTWIAPEHVIEHVPAPLEVKVGDKWKSSKNCEYVYEIVYVMGDKAVWVAEFRPGNFTSGIMSTDLVREHISQFGNFKNEVNSNER